MFFWEVAVFGKEAWDRYSETAYPLDQVVPTALVCLLGFPKKAANRVGEFRLTLDYSYLKNDVPWNAPDTTCVRLDRAVRAVVCAGNQGTIAKYPCYY